MVTVVRLTTIGGPRLGTAASSTADISSVVLLLTTRSHHHVGPSRKLICSTSKPFYLLCGSGYYKLFYTLSHKLFSNRITLKFTISFLVYFNLFFSPTQSKYRVRTLNYASSISCIVKGLKRKIKDTITWDSNEKKITRPKQTKHNRYE